MWSGNNLDCSMMSIINMYTHTLITVYGIPKMNYTFAALSLNNRGGFNFTSEYNI